MISCQNSSSQIQIEHSLLCQGSILLHIIIKLSDPEILRYVTFCSDQTRTPSHMVQCEVRRVLRNKPGSSKTEKNEQMYQSAVSDSAHISGYGGSMPIYKNQNSGID